MRKSVGRVPHWKSASLRFRQFPLRLAGQKKKHPGKGARALGVCLTGFFKTNYIPRRRVGKKKTRGSYGRTLGGEKRREEPVNTAGFLEFCFATKIEEIEYT